LGRRQHIEHWARHLLHLCKLASMTGGITEFVPLAFVHMEAPLYRKGPTFREAILMHAVDRLVLHPFVKNVQASWVKMGAAGIRAALHAGAKNGQEMTAEALTRLIESCGCVPRQRTTLYSPPTKERMAAAVEAGLAGTLNGA
jgi:FO synthase